MQGAGWDRFHHPCDGHLPCTSNVLAFYWGGVYLDLAGAYCTCRDIV